MIEVEQLSKTYGSTTAIDNITFAAEPGEILGLLGPNGAGKTTTMRILAGYLPASQGTARIAGFEVHSHPMAVRKRIGYLPETPPLYLDMTVAGYLTFVARIKGVAAGDRTPQVNWAMEQCNLLEKRHVLMHKLSKGFRQRVGIAQAIVHDPPAIILDEPTIGLDPRQIIDVRNLIKSLAGNKTVILSTHILPEASMTCDRVAIINKGHMVATVKLPGETGYDLKVKGSQADIEARLTPIPGVQSVQWLSTKGALPQNSLKLRVTTTAEVELGHLLSATLIEAGIELYELKRTATSLEDTFLRLTTEEEETGEVELDNQVEPDSTPRTPAIEPLADGQPNEANPDPLTNTPAAVTTESNDCLDTTDQEISA